MRRNLSYISAIRKKAKTTEQMNHALEAIDMGIENTQNAIKTISENRILRCEHNLELGLLQTTRFYIQSKIALFEAISETHEKVQSIRQALRRADVPHHQRDLLLPALGLEIN